jgi:hypothetical protein
MKVYQGEFSHFDGKEQLFKVYHVLKAYRKKLKPVEFSVREIANSLYINKMDIELQKKTVTRR